MGRQIQVELQALRALCHLDFYEEEFEHWGEGDTLVDEVVTFAIVCLPDWRTITLTVYGTVGVIDCAGPESPTHWFEEWMVNNKVLYLDS